MEEHFERAGESHSRLQIAKQATSALLEIPEHHIVKVVLGGSSARGDAQPYSDIDLYAIVDDTLTPKGSRLLVHTARLTDYLHQKGFKTGQGVLNLDLGCVPQAFLDHPEDLPPPVRERMLALNKEGIVLYPVPDKSPEIPI